MKLWRMAAMLPPLGGCVLGMLFCAGMILSAPQNQVTSQPGQYGGLISPSAADLMTLREESIATDAAGLEEWIKQRVLGEEELVRIDRLVIQLGDEEFQKREEASKTLTGYGPRARAALRKGVDHKDPEIRARSTDVLRVIEINHTPLIQAAALRVLGRLQKGKPPGSEITILDFLRPKENQVLLESAMEAMAFLASEWTEPPQPILDALKKRAPADRYPLLLALLKSGKSFGVEIARQQASQSDPEARCWAAMALCFSGADPSYMGLLIDHMSYLDEPSFFLAEDIGYRMGEPNSPEPAPVLSSSDRERRIAAWKTWWTTRKNQPMTLRDPLLPAGPGGSTMVVILEQGKIIDLDVQKKPRWQINELEYPLDAQLLPGPRVLVAEHGGLGNRLGDRITERDIKGRILWAKGYSQPLTAQRLASGITLIAGEYGFTEVDLNGQDLVTWSPAGNERVMKLQRRYDGFTAVVLKNGDEGEKSRLVWLDRSFRERATFPVQVGKSGGRVEILPGDHVLLPEFENNRVAQFDATGKVVWSANLDQVVACVVTPSGTIMANFFGNRGAAEIDKSGKEIWNFQTDAKVTRAWRR